MGTSNDLKIGDKLTTDEKRFQSVRSHIISKSHGRYKEMLNQSSLFHEE